MSATAQATAMADNCAASGKSAKKKSCSGKGGGLGSLILYGIIGIVLFTGVMMVIKYMKGDLPDCTDDLIAKKTPCKPPVNTPKPSPLKSSPYSPSPYSSSPLKSSPQPSPYTSVEIAEPAPFADQSYEGEEMYAPTIEDSFVNTPSSE
jgi:cell division septation protein DedD